MDVCEDKIISVSVSSTAQTRFVHYPAHIELLIFWHTCSTARCAVHILIKLPCNSIPAFSSVIWLGKKDQL